MEVGGGLQDVLRGGLLCFLPFSTHLPCLPHLPFQRLKPEERGEVTFQPLIFFPTFLLQATMARREDRRPLHLGPYFLLLKEGVALLLSLEP